MKRRDFVKTSSTLTVGASLIGNAKSWSGANDKIRTAIIGMGGRGNQHMGTVGKMDGVEIVALADPDERRVNKGVSDHEKQFNTKPAGYQDLRKIIDDNNIDAVMIATSNHWHALAGIWAMQSGKHAYVEKPVSHNVFEGRQLVETARKYKRVCQGGTQRRSYGLYRKAVQLLQEGIIGDIFMGRALVYGPRGPIGNKPPSPIPSWLNWDVWLGPAQEQPYHENLTHYNWHWIWTFGNGELGNNGSHILDVIRWGMNRKLPNQIQSSGGRFAFEDQGETPNTQHCTFDFDDGAYITCEIRNLSTNFEAHLSTWGGMFYGTKGYMAINDSKYEIYLGRSKEPLPDKGRLDNIQHQQNFFDAVRANDPKKLTADIEDTHLSCAYCLLGNISYRLNHELRFDPKEETFIDDTEANRMLTRDYRDPYVVPEEV